MNCLFVGDQGLRQARDHPRQSANDAAALPLHTVHVVPLALDLQGPTQDLGLDQRHALDQGQGQGHDQGHRKGNLGKGLMCSNLEIDCFSYCL